MKIKEAVSLRILQLYSILSKKSANPGIVTIKKICDGLNIGVIPFFTCELFADLEQEIE